MKKTMTINEMILNTLTTKLTKKPKYKKELEELGIQIVDSENWSNYGYWAIRLEATNKSGYLLLVVSKDYAKVKGIFATEAKICNWEGDKIHKIDWFNFIKVHGTRIDYPNFANSIFSNKVHEAIWLLKHNKVYDELAEVEARKEEEARKAKIRYIGQIHSNKERLKELFPNYDVSK